MKRKACHSRPPAGEAGVSRNLVLIPTTIVVVTAFFECTN
jgi:hypothetical protein